MFTVVPRAFLPQVTARGFMLGRDEKRIWLSAIPDSSIVRSEVVLNKAKGKVDTGLILLGDSKLASC